MWNWGRLFVPKFDETVWRLLNRTFSIRRAEQSASLDSSTGAHKCISQSRCNQSLVLFSFYSRHVKFARNFSTSSITQAFKQMSEQDKEKFRNYRLFAILFAALLFVCYMLCTMEYHQDYVYIERSEDKK